jgi:ribonuclease HI
MASRIRIATDGSVLKNPDGPGGWAVVFDDGRTFVGSDPSTTNNRMEMKAVLEGLKLIDEGSDVIVECDSQYVCKGIRLWMPNWRRKNWKNAAGDDVKNRDLWEEIDEAIQRHTRVTMLWVRGHDGHAANELADKLAGEAARAAMEETLLMGMPPEFVPEAIAREFHETYERLAPDHGYETRQESRVDWEDVPENNRRLMAAVAEELLERGVISYGAR